MRNNYLTPTGNSASRRTCRWLPTRAVHLPVNCLPFALWHCTQSANLTRFFLPNPLISRVCTPFHINQIFFFTPLFGPLHLIPDSTSGPRYRHSVAALPWQKHTQS